jgi:uroporphyrin-III C-methyltransferase
VSEENAVLVEPQVTLVGAGPGDPELLTVKAIKALRRATVVLVDDLVDPGVRRYARRHARIIPVGKRGGCVSTPQAFIHKLMVAEALRGERVVRLKGGDPFVFGRGGEEADALRAAGLRVAVVGIPVTDRRHAPGVALITGHAQVREGDEPSSPQPDWAALARSGLTLVIYMGVSRVQTLADELLQAGMPASRPAAVISAAHTPRQRAVRSTLSRLAEDVAEQGILSPAVLVVGDVAAMGQLEGLAQDGHPALADDAGSQTPSGLAAGHLEDQAGRRRVGI